MLCHTCERRGIPPRLDAPFRRARREALSPDKAKAAELAHLRRAIDARLREHGLI